MPAAQAEWAAAEACALLGTGCHEAPPPAPGMALLELWAPEGRVAPGALRDALRSRGIDADVRADPQDDRWREAMRAFHRPVDVAGRLRVRPPWAPAAPAMLDVVIDPGMAFGTAQHGTTRACLAMLCGMETRGAVLDAGCGSGVLAIAARRLGFAPVTAVDSDPLAVEATIANARANGVALTVARRAIGADPLPAADVILANLTLTVLRVLAGALPAPAPAHMVLSGLRPDEAPEAAGLFAGAGLREAERVQDDGWTTVRLARPHP